MLQHLGVPVATEKTEGPATSVTFLGVLIDTHNLELRLPSDKLSRLQALVSDWQKKHTCTRKELESLLGHLSHAATVVRPGRTFLRSLFSLLHVAKAPHHFIRLDKGSRADLAWWRCFLQRWNGSSFLPLPTPAAHVHSDASGNYGCGAANCLTPLPVGEAQLFRFVAFLYNSSLGYQCIRSYLSAVCHLQITQGFPDPSLSSFPRISYALRGVRRESS